MVYINIIYNTVDMYRPTLHWDCAAHYSRCWDKMRGTHSERSSSGMIAEGAPPVSRRRDCSRLISQSCRVQWTYIIPIESNFSVSVVQSRSNTSSPPPQTDKPLRSNRFILRCFSGHTIGDVTSGVHSCDNNIVL